MTTAAEVLKGWREGCPVLDSLAEEQEVVADAYEVLHDALIAVEELLTAAKAEVT